MVVFGGEPSGEGRGAASPGASDDEADVGRSGSDLGVEPIVTALEVGVVVVPGATEVLDRFLQVFVAFRPGGEGDPQGLVLQLHPAGTDAEVQASS